MTVWLYALLSPRLAHWLAARYEIQALPVRDLELRDADDEIIYHAAAQARALVITKDRDFVDPNCVSDLR